MSVQDARGEKRYETRYIESHFTSRRGKGYIVTTKRCVACDERVHGEGMARHLDMNPECRETLLKRLES